ncbi:hypothetical protein QAD02_002560 [Eretmocerus hayati]|uniref:Uncharacterized protein n=1 Tax=Eretmocerus hayati TaxID=131215 RepID=A0ACC2NJN7_9HYME|nr:hypothetical protein QAD02_002560 [Eretmocerus hayati]
MALLKERNPFQDIGISKDGNHTRQTRLETVFNFMLRFRRRRQYPVRILSPVLMRVQFYAFSILCWPDHYRLCEFIPNKSLNELHMKYPKDRRGKEAQSFRGAYYDLRVCCRKRPRFIVLFIDGDGIHVVCNMLIECYEKIRGWRFHY